MSWGNHRQHIETVGHRIISIEAKKLVYIVIQITIAEKGRTRGSFCETVYQLPSQMLLQRR